MSQFVQHSLSPERLLAIGNNILYKAFLEATRIDSKRLYAGLLDGGVATLLTMNLDDNTEVKINLGINAEDYQGKLNYGSFKKHVALLIARINERLQSNSADKLNMRSDSNGENHLFNIPAMIRDGDKVNILMFGMSTQSPGQLLFSLNYLDSKKQSVAA